MIKYIMFLCVALAFHIEMYAQTAEDSLKSVIYNFAKAYSELGSTGNKANILQYMDKQVKSTLVIRDIGDNTKTIYGDYKDFEKHLDRIIKLKGMNINYKIANLIITYVRANAGVAAYTVKFKTSRYGKVWVKGTETVSLAFKKFPDKTWRIVHYTVIAVEDQKVKGACTCELFKKELASTYAIKTIIPAGEEYKTRIEECKFSPPVNGNRLIQIGKNKYKWMANGYIYTYKKDEKDVKKTKLGSTKSERAAILYILHRDMYTKSCARLKILKN